MHAHFYCLNTFVLQRFSAERSFSYDFCIPLDVTHRDCHQDHARDLPGAEAYNQHCASPRITDGVTRLPNTPAQLRTGPHHD